jgi:hypothetical protein
MTADANPDFPVSCETKAIIRSPAGATMVEVSCTFKFHDAAALQAAQHNVEPEFRQMVDRVFPDTPVPRTLQ